MILQFFRAQARADPGDGPKSSALLPGQSLADAFVRASLPPVPGDELADELLHAVLTASPLEGSLFGFPGYDERLPDFSREAESAHASTLASIATRAEQAPEDGPAPRPSCRRSTSCAASPAAWPRRPRCPSSNSPSATPSRRRSATCWRHSPRSRWTPTSAARATWRGCAASRTCSPRSRSAMRTAPGRAAPAVGRLVEAAIAQLDLLIDDHDHGRHRPRRHRCCVRRRRVRCHRRLRPSSPGRLPGRAAGRPCSPSPATTTTRASATCPTARTCTASWPGCTPPSTPLPRSSMPWAATSSTRPWRRWSRPVRSCSARATSSRSSSA